MWEKLDPSVVHFSNRRKGVDHYPLNMGDYEGPLTELTFEMAKKPGLVAVLEIDARNHHPSGSSKVVIEESLDFLSKHS